MKKTKQILSLVLVLIIALSCITLAISVSAFTPSEEPVLYFEVPEDWANYTSIYCHIWPYGEESFANWQSKKERCTDEGNGIYSYNITKRTGHTLEEDTMYCVIFFADTGMQTYELLFDKNCFGDTAYCDGRMYENPADSNKTAQAAFWKNQDPAEYGPILNITSLGNIVGTVLPVNVTESDLLLDFLTGYNLDSARTYSGKNDQQLIDDIADSLGLSNDMTKKVIEESDIYVDWTPGNLKDDPYILIGDVNLDGEINIKDATAIQKHIAELATNSAVGSKIYIVTE